jgi:3-isopropylmalate/(R)-2-methylmalate dehydratase small subunit
MSASWERDAMQPFTTLTGIAAPLYRPNVNTDIIIPMQFLVGTPRETMGENAFAPWRYVDAGDKVKRRENPDFVLNQAPFRDATILLAGPNFACGSSREGAVWALAGFGFRAVIAPSFGGIFANNCFQSGVLPVVLPEDVVAGFVRQAEAAPHTARFTVDLEACVVRPPQGEAVAFEVEAFRRTALLEGLDDLGLIRRRQSDIDAFQAADRAARPWVYGASPS